MTAPRTAAMPRGFATGVLAILLAAAATAPPPAEALKIDWFTVEGGGGTSTGGTLALTGTFGQSDAGSLGAGTLEVRGGFWAAPGATATAIAGLVEPALPLAYHLGLGAPNPFRARTALRFALPRPAHARVRVFDVSGRLVSTLVDERLEAGRHESVWDGHDQAGNRVASGVYFVRMQAEGYGATRKVVRLD